jgi:hypothetical protein
MVSYRMFEPFSRGYYLGRLYVEPVDEARASMCRADHERVNEQLYTTGEGVERVDTPGDTFRSRGPRTSRQRGWPSPGRSSSRSRSATPRP